MAKILFVADLHGNMVATEALEKEIEKIKPDEDKVMISGINFRLFHGRPVAANRADEYPEMPDKEAYKNEVLTGVYRG